MNFTLRTLRYIVAAAESGNISEAARRLHVSQPSVSAAIADYEAALGVPLFLRHHAKGVTPTPAGRRLVTEARVLIKHAEDFNRMTQSLGGALQGEIDVGCFSTIAARYLPTILAAFGRDFPGIAVHVDIGDQEHVLGALAEGRSEFAITYDLGVPGGMVSRMLVELPPCAVLQAGHRLAAEKAVRLTELAAEPLVLLDLAISREYFFSLFHASGVEPRIAWRARSYEFVRGLVAAGQGYAIHNVIPQTDTTYDGGELVIRPFAEPLPTARVVLLSLPSLSMRPAVAAFADYLEDAFRAQSRGPQPPPG
jgi:DNA-binding transcriptional LysR family regulator